MFIDEGTLIRITCNDNAVYTGKVYKIVIQPNETIEDGAQNKFRTLIFISQDKRYIKDEGEFGCIDIYTDYIKKIEKLPL